jgi:predicted GIY-YIG superfamily endonuclease
LILAYRRLHFWRASCLDPGMNSNRVVYILRSDVDADRHCVGLTSDVARRLHWHNNGPSGVTVHHRPWSFVVSLEFADARVASRFERYLKTGSGRAFAKRHFGVQAGELWTNDSDVARAQESWKAYQEGKPRGQTK